MIECHIIFMHNLYKKPNLLAIMENKHVGYLILGISIIIIAIVFLFRSALRLIIKSSCTGEHGLSCPMFVTLNQQTYLSLAIVAVLISISIVLILNSLKSIITDSIM